MRDIKIPINKARIQSFAVELKDDIPVVTATIGLFMGETKISTFSIGTQSWNDNHFDLPAEMVSPILEISDQLEQILVRQCQAALKLIQGGFSNA